MKFCNAFLLIVLLAASCQPKAKTTVIENPTSGFSRSLADSLTGAASVQDLGNYLFLSLKGDITFYELQRFFPDSAAISLMYELTHTSTQDADLAAIADTALNQLLTGWTRTQREATQVGENWTDAKLIRIRIQEMDNQVLPGRKITIECQSDKETLRASAKCLKIGDRWYIGEDIKFGV